MRVVAAVLLIVLWSLNYAGATGRTLSLQCQSPRKDVFSYSAGRATGIEEWSTGEMVPTEYQLVGFDSSSLKAVFFTLSGFDDPYLNVITLFEIDFANPASQSIATAHPSRWSLSSRAAGDWTRGGSWCSRPTNRSVSPACLGSHSYRIIGHAHARFHP